MGANPENRQPAQRTDAARRQENGRTAGGGAGGIRGLGEGDSGAGGQHPGTRRDPRDMPLVAIKDLLWWFYLYPLRGAALVLPPGITRGLTPVFAPLFQVVATKRKRIVRARMAQAFDVKPDDPRIRRTARRYVRNAVRRALDDLVMNRLVISGEGFPGGVVRGTDHLDKALSFGRGAVVVTGHFYANRLGKRHIAEMGYSMMSTRHSSPPDMLMGRFGHTAMQPRYVDFLRTIIRDEVSPTDPDCSLRILERLRGNGLVNVHLDAAFSRERVRMSFLRGERRFAKGVFDIARLAGAAMIPLLCTGNSSAFQVEFSEPIPPGSRVDAARFMEDRLPRLVSRLEAQILAHPDEWELWTRI